MKFPYGELLTTVPKNFTPPEMWPEYEAASMPRSPSTREKIDADPPGIRWGIWPLYFEEYISDKEPDLVAGSAQGKLLFSRFVAWRRIERTDIPKGWRAFSKRPWRVDGFVDVEKNYRDKWSPQARRNIRLWEKRYAQEYVLEKISIEEYKEAYAQSTVRKKIGFDAFNILERKEQQKETSQYRELWGIRSKATGMIIAGISFCFSPTANRCVYEAPFILPEAKKTYAMTALIDHWFASTLAHNMSQVVFSSFWQPGEASSWKNFSAFKSQFNPTCVGYPPTLWKFVRGKFL